MNKENLRYFGDTESEESSPWFSPLDLDGDANLLPKIILNALEVGLSVTITKSGLPKYYVPEFFDLKDIPGEKAELQEKTEEHQQFLRTKKPY